MKFVFYLIFTVLLISCSVRLPPIPQEPTDTADCGAACLKLKELGCEEGNDLENGVSCEAFCIDTQINGHGLNPSCIKSITDCSELERCLYGR